jgi:hypothetical protein
LLYKEVYKKSLTEKPLLCYLTGVIWGCFTLRKGRSDLG